MRYVTSVERMARQEGIEQGIEQALREAVVETLRVRFENVPGTLEELLTQVKQEDQLRALFRQALVVDALATFEAAVVQMMTGNGSDSSASDNAATTAL